LLNSPYKKQNNGGREKGVVLGADAWIWERGEIA
jgi:hypothetical protein